LRESPDPVESRQWEFRRGGPWSAALTGNLFKQPFVQAERPSSSMGLYICRSIAHARNGTIQAYIMDTARFARLI
jgi:hypothetical protein